MALKRTRLHCSRFGILCLGLSYTLGCARLGCYVSSDANGILCIRISVCDGWHFLSHSLCLSPSLSPPPPPLALPPPSLSLFSLLSPSHTPPPTPRYKLELVGHGRKLIWEAKPRSVHESIGSVISNNDCLIFETTMAQHFGENGNLAINVTIFKSIY